MTQLNMFSKLALAVSTAALLTAGYAHAEPVRKDFNSSVSRSGPNHSMSREMKANINNNAMQRQQTLTVDGQTAQRNVDVQLDESTNPLTRSATPQGPDGQEYSSSRSVTVPDVNRTVETNSDPDNGQYSRTVTTSVNGNTTSVTRNADLTDQSAAVSNARTVNGKTVSAATSAELDEAGDTLTTSTTVTGPDGKQYHKDAVRSIASGEE